MKKSFLLLTLFSILIFSFVSPKPNTLDKLLSRVYAKVPAGEAMVNGEKQKVETFYISKTEISNLDYREFLSYLKVENPELYKNAIPDTSVWANDLNSNYQNIYLRNPGFSLYPVVGVSFEQANSYCKWIEKILNDKYKNEASIVVRLPTEAEWIRAARGDNHAYKFPWGGPYLQTGKGKALANYLRESTNMIDTKNSNNNSIITAEVHSFVPNTYGIYQMSGNVAELTNDPKTIKGGAWSTKADDLLIDSKNNLTVPSQSVGFRIVISVKS